MKVKKDLIHNLKFVVDNGIFNCFLIESGISNKLASNLGNVILFPLCDFNILEWFGCVFERECVGSSDMDKDMDMDMDIHALAKTRKSISKYETEAKK